MKSHKNTSVGGHKNNSFPSQWEIPRVARMMDDLGNVLNARTLRKIYLAVELDITLNVEKSQIDG
jgi:hypothetical protein